MMPIIGVIFRGGINFADYFFPLSSTVTATTLAEAKRQGNVFAYGSFITVLINFIILAFIVFLMVKGVNTMRRRMAAQKPVEPDAPPADIELLTEIRDLLAARPR